MKVTKSQIINGIVSYAENELIPKITDKPIQIVFATAVMLLKANPAISNPIFEHKFLTSLMPCDKDGLYELDGLFTALGDSIRMYGDFPVKLPTVPILSPEEKVLTLKVDDISEIKRRISEAKA